MHFSNHVDIENGPPLPPPNNVGMTKNSQDRLKCTGLHKLKHCYGARGKVGEINS